MNGAMGVGLLTIALMATIGWWEWRRQDSTRRGFRMAALVLTALALFFLGRAALAPAVTPLNEPEHVTLVTDGAGLIPPTDGRIANLGTAFNGGSDRALVPDAAYVRRTSPAVTEFSIAGVGVTAADAAALAGRRVTRAGVIDAPAVPMIDVLTAPREVALGDAVRVQGRVTGLAPGATLGVALEAPDGTVRTVEVVAGPAGNGAFSVDGGVPVAVGNFEWRLRLGSRGEAVTLGVSVVQPDLPRVLFWESSPTTEAARLRRWLGEIGAPSAARVQVSADRVRTTGNGAGELEQLSGELLAGFDLLICDAAAYVQLTGAELTALMEMVRDDGLGLLVVAGEVLTSERADFSLPWSLVKEEASAEEAARRVRLRLYDGTLLEEPVAVTRATIVEKGNGAGRSLAVDPLDRAVAVSFAQGRGQVAVSLVQDSWRWQQQGHERVFARFWTSLLSALARPASAAISWHLLEGDRPYFVDHPVRFGHSGPGELAEKGPIVVGPGMDESISLEPQAGGVATLWPRTAGWHHLTTETSAARRSFYVQPPQTLPGVRDENRRRLTDRLVVDSPVEPEAEPRSADTGRNAQGLVFLVLLGALTGLWIEERWRKRG